VNPSPKSSLESGTCGEGKFVAADKEVVGLETDKATFGVPAPVGGVVTRILKKAGESAAIGEVIGYLQPSDAPAATAAPAPSPRQWLLHQRPRQLLRKLVVM
jgi:pyruvate/2-oxoglutarate dehydrogenase complex dihydrolipoamide acyltransferase (E2) component